MVCERGACGKYRVHEVMGRQVSLREETPESLLPFLCVCLCVSGGGGGTHTGAGSEDAGRHRQGRGRDLTWNRVVRHGGLPQPPECGTCLPPLHRIPLQLPALPCTGGERGRVHYGRSDRMSSVPADENCAKGTPRLVFGFGTFLVWEAVSCRSVTLGHIPSSPAP